MMKIGTLALAVAVSAMVMAGGARAQTTADSTSTSGAGAVAIAEGSGFTYAPVSNVTYPKNTPSMSLGSFGQGANPCAEGQGFNIGASGFGIGFNNASSHAGCMRLLAARAILASAEIAPKHPQYAHAALLVACQHDTQTLQGCQGAGVYHQYAAAQPAYAPAQPAPAYGAAAYGAAYGHASHAQAAPPPVRQAASHQMVPILAPAYAPASAIVPAWCHNLGGYEAQKYRSACGGY